MAHIHASAVVDGGARLGADVEIGPLAYVGPDVEIGDGTVVGPHATVLPHTTLGPRCRVHACAVVGDLPQDLSFKGGVSRVRIGAGCVIREGVTIHRGTKPDTETVVGEDCFLMANAHLAHNVRLGRRVILANGALLGGYVEVGDGAFISGNGLVHQFVRVGRLAMLGGGCGVSKDVPPFVTMASVRYNRVAGLNVIGLRRAGVGPDQRLALQRAFRTLYRSGLGVRDAVVALKAEFGDGPARELWEFVEQSKRGICVLGGGDVDAGDDA